MKLFEVLLNERVAPEIGKKYDKKFSSDFFEPDPRIESIRSKSGVIKMGDRVCLIRQPSKKGKVVGFFVEVDSKNVITGFKALVDLSRKGTNYIGKFAGNELEKIKKKLKEEQGGKKKVGKYTVVTSFDYPPIPSRDADWSAVLDGYDAGDPIGRGRTEEKAIEDLIDQIESKDD
jgi:hypothetical protein